MKYINPLWEIIIKLNAHGAQKANEDFDSFGTMPHWKEGDELVCLSSTSDGKEYNGWGLFRSIGPA